MPAYDQPAGAAPKAALVTGGANGETNKAATNHSGFYSLRNLPSGEYRVSISHPGFLPYRQNGIKLSAGQRLQLDVELPQVSGFKILSVLRHHPQTSAIPLVMLTARTEQKDLLQALSLGADAYLSKPVTVAALRSMVDRMLRGSS